MKQNEQAIGVFDSGVGGLTVATAIKDLLPHENLIYFGDTAHLPYGDKSAHTIRKYSKQVANFLLEKQCKVILIACNTASAHAYQAVKNLVKDRAIVINVIDPMVAHLAGLPKAKKVGVIGTKGTIKSNTYPERIAAQLPDLEVVSLATPLFVPMIEEGFIYDDISNGIIKAYLKNEQLSSIDSLILACTHYPIIKNQIRKFFNFQVDVLDSAKVVAQGLRDILSEKNLLNTQKEPASYQFYVSDYTEMFEKIARIFFDMEIKLKVKS